MKSFLSFFLALLVLPGAAMADWRPVERVEHYAVTGSTGIELYRSIGENGPSVGVGRAIAYTDFDLLWSRDYRPQADGSCVLASAVPSLTITYRLPRAPAALPAHTQRLWDVFIAGVEKHERVHGEILLDMTRQIEAVSVGLRAENDPDCQKVRAELQRQLVAISEERHERNREFDRVELSEGGNVHQLVLALVNG
ncbi:MAG: DUF922 domain-containing protein [Mesorhizobium sp.]|nr:DUF922 domain-containing protein [Mesorhizobium sp.]